MPVELSDEQDDPVEHETMHTVAAAVVRGEQLPADTEISLTLVDEATMAELNHSHMGRSGPTDVLSFPIETMAPGLIPTPIDGGPPLVLGDVIICPPVVRRNADSAEVPFEDEMALMVVHGILHLLGYDHEDDGDAEVMEQRERDLLASVGRVRP